MSELLDCPFCSGAAEMDSQQAYAPLGGGPSGTRVAIYCTECPADIGFCREDVPEVSLEALMSGVTALWNARPKNEVAKTAARVGPIFLRLLCEKDYESHPDKVDAVNLLFDDLNEIIGSAIEEACTTTNGAAIV